MAEIQVLVELSSGVQSGRDPGHLGDHPALQGGELTRIEPLRQLRHRLVQCLTTGQLGHHQEALQAGVGTDLFAGRDDFGHVHPQLPGTFEAGPFGGRRRVSPGGVEHRRDPDRPRRTIVPLQVDGERTSRWLRDVRAVRLIRMEDDSRGRSALLGVETIRGMEGHDRGVESLGQVASIRLVDPGPAHASGPTIPERSVPQRASPSHDAGRWKR